MTRLAGVIVCFALLSACADRSPAPELAAADEAALRIVALAPHLTEMVYAIGAGDYLVGVVAHSDFPEQARTLPVVGDAFRIDPERLAAMEPDLILAWQGGNPDAVIGQLVSRGYKVVALPAGKLLDIPENIVRIGELTGRQDTAAGKAQQFIETLDRLRHAHRSSSPVKVFYQISRQPLYTIGHSHPIGEMIELCGGRNLFDDLHQVAAVVNLEDVLSRNPDVIISGDDNAQLEAWLRWDDIGAVRNNNLFAVDASLVTRPGLRMLQGAQQICSRLERARTVIEPRH